MFTNHGCTSKFGGNSSREAKTIFAPSTTQDTTDSYERGCCFFRHESKGIIDALTLHETCLWEETEQMESSTNGRSEDVDMFVTSKCK